MKLAYCKACRDVVRPFTKWRQCKCGAVAARLRPGFTDVQGDAIVLGVAEDSIRNGSKASAETGESARIPCFVVNVGCRTVVRYPEVKKP